MTDLLRELCFGTYEPKANYHDMSAEDRAVWEKVKTILGREMMDELLYSQCQILQENYLDWFREGFRLGALLMLELR